MARIERDFSQRPAEEQQDFLTQTWCNDCMEADLGMTAPQEFEQNGVVYIVGRCKRCGGEVTTELSEED
ncbi:hypothetical protein [Motiliproteus sediminis]|uniref:hypothetical protein n=1 Tax=Motiliproteus sediminis TaxID=1468178 RepID=UPI001AEFDB33|nr:hypothetical protein [Motiliproteus sediminis]